MNIKLLLVEKRILELLGICHFRKLVFLLEKIIHFKDKGYNTNYHLKYLRKNATEDFKKFLLYNAIIHIRNLIIFLIILAINVIFETFKFNWYWIALIIFAVKDLYCILLQRYNYLRIKITEYNYSLAKLKFCENTRQKISRLISKQEYSLSAKKEDLLFIRNLINRINTNEIVYIEKNEYESVRRLSKYLKE